MSVEVYRVIKYEIREGSEADRRWLEHTLKMSIDGRYELPNGCVITAVVVPGMDDAYEECGIFNELAQADTRPWLPPHAEQRARSRGDV